MPLRRLPFSSSTEIRAALCLPGGPGEYTPSDLGQHEDGRRRDWSVTLVQRQPSDVARLAALVAMRGHAERIGQFPVLGFVAPLHRGVSDDIIGSAMRASWRVERVAARLLLMTGAPCASTASNGLRKVSFIFRQLHESNAQMKSSAAILGASYRDWNSR
jgi:hypothetical protein